MSKEQSHSQDPNASEGPYSGPILVDDRQGLLDMDTGQIDEVFVRITEKLEKKRRRGLTGQGHPLPPDLSGGTAPLFDPVTVSSRSKVDREIGKESPGELKSIRSGEYRISNKKKTEETKIKDGTYRIVGEPMVKDPEEKDKSADTPKQKKRLRQKLNKLAKNLREQKAAQDEVDEKAERDKVFVVGADGQAEVISSKTGRIKALKKNIGPKLKKKLAGLTEERIPPMLKTSQKIASLVATGASVVAGHNVPVPHLGSEAAKPSNRPAAITAQPLDFTKEGIIEFLPEAKKEESTSFVQEPGKIIYPPDINPEIWLPSVQMPEIQGLLKFMTPEDEGEFGRGEHATPPEERFGNSDLVGTVYTVARAYQAKYKDSYLLIGDLNAPGHDSHKSGIDVDIYLPDTGLKISSKNYDKDRAVDLGIMLMKTGKMDLIFFNDDYVIEKVNQFAIENGLSGRMEKSPKHEVHMHARIKEKEPTINIPWMPENVTRWNNIVIAKAKKYKIDPELVSIIMYKESSGNPDARSWVGATGLMQIMPDTAAGIARELGIEEYDLSDPETNIDFGTYYLRQLLKKFGKVEHGPSWDMSVMLDALGYNGGPGAAEGYLAGAVNPDTGPFCESREYGYYVLGMWRERHQPTSEHFDEYNQIGHRCNADPTSYPIDSLK
ncbi:MAG TPA: transglycosylase SLT domain-containing protein [Xanthomonadales bacterium]|nr:transglycosylase SLT domain-containing protein [Xanthomonadales bacterium]